VSVAAGLLEAAVRRDRAAVVLGLGAMCALAWAWLLPASLDMYGTMRGLSAWMMAPAWDARYALLVFLMWTVMMVAMMLPSAAPAILIFGRVVRGSRDAPVLRSYAFAAGYLLSWTAFSAAATTLQWLLWRAGALDPMMQVRAPLLGAALLGVAGVYQFTAMKRACLAQCRGPMDFLSRHWRPGAFGALRMGAAHGAFCVGCCWGLMLLLFTGGVMNLAWIVAIAVFVLVEKLAPRGAQGGRLSGALLLLAGGVLAAQSFG
jgi:predicted metal-binding membrane protein